MLVIWSVAVGVALLGALLVAGSFVPDDAMLVVPLPEGPARKRLRPVGVMIMLLALLVPPVGNTLVAPPITPPPTVTPTETATAAPTIPLVPTITPIPPTPTRTRTPGPTAPSQPIMYMPGDH